MNPAEQAASMALNDPHERAQAARWAYYEDPTYDTDLAAWRARRRACLGVESPEEKRAFDNLQAERDREARKQ